MNKTLLADTQVLPAPTVSSCYSSPMSYRHVVSINKILRSVDEWNEELYIIRNAGPYDQVHVYINSGGGDLDVANEICNAMKQCPAYIVCEIVGSCASAATLIYLQGDEHVVNDNTQMMVHTATHGYVGQDKQVYDYSAFSTDYIECLLRAAYEGFLTEEEIKNMLNGKEYWFKADNVKDRLALRAESSKKDEAGYTKVTRSEINKMTKANIVKMLFPSDEVDEVLLPDYNALLGAPLAS